MRLGLGGPACTSHPPCDASPWSGAACKEPGTWSRNERAKAGPRMGWTDAFPVIATARWRSHRRLDMSSRRTCMCVCAWPGLGRVHIYSGRPQQQWPVSMRFDLDISIFRFTFRVVVVVLGRLRSPVHSLVCAFQSLIHWTFAQSSHSFNPILSSYL